MIRRTAARRRHNACVAPIALPVKSPETGIAFQNDTAKKSRPKAGIFLCGRQPILPLKAHASALPRSEAASREGAPAGPIRPATQKIPVWFQLSFLAHARLKRLFDGLEENRPSAAAIRFLKIYLLNQQLE
jgi:hypothetical protein